MKRQANRSLRASPLVIQFLACIRVHQVLELRPIEASAIKCQDGIAPYKAVADFAAFVAAGSEFRCFRSEKIGRRIRRNGELLSHSDSSSSLLCEGEISRDIKT